MQKLELEPLHPEETMTTCSSIVSQLFTDPIVHSCCFDRFYSIFQHSGPHKFSCFVVIDLNINFVKKYNFFSLKLQDILQTFSL